eukprot:TRINITY_DN3460_c0_g1_i5.p1 TRINITY_DN3460_c0_g1~~TRINITY_DN3460_c0_g1_i5.p1  ORF type:complete len:373 (-),score=40.82 TRINITY_DN3460_c0_g1_i5:6-1124(-)
MTPVFVMDWSDHVWTEIYSDYKGSWVHADSCETAYDRPLLYESGWNKKLSYVFAFNGNEVVDVIRRYTRNFEEVATRRTIDEAWLQSQIQILDTIQLQSSSLTTEQIETRRLRRIHEQSDLAKKRQLHQEELQGRESGGDAWKKARGEIGEPVPDLSSAKERMKFPHPGIRGSLITVADANVSNENIRLTPASNDKRGAVWFKEMIGIKNGFISKFKFCIRNAGADGFAFVIQCASPKVLGEGGSGLGYQGVAKSLAVEFDNYASVDRCEDPNGNHISIHTNGKRANSAHHDYSIACNIEIPPLADGEVHSVEVVYKNKQLFVILDSATVLQVGIDLPEKIGNESAWFGFTAATGGLSQEHLITEWSIAESV